MHRGAVDDIAALLVRAPQDTKLVLDVGSQDINGSYRELVEGRGWRYVGLDIQEGKNVDVVAVPYHYPFTDGAFDVVISGSTAEHVAHPWLWFPELARILKPGGLLAVLTCHSFPEHRYPVDCWRFMEDGLRVLFDLTGVLEAYEFRYVSVEHIVGSALRCSI